MRSMLPRFVSFLTGCALVASAAAAPRAHARALVQPVACAPVSFVVAQNRYCATHQKPQGSGGSYAGPGDTVPSGGVGKNAPADTAPPAGGSPNKPAVNGRPAMTPAPAQAPQGPTSPFLPATQAAEASNDANWWMWWEFNKTEFIQPNRVVVRLGLTTGIETPAEREALLQARLDLLRGGLDETFRDELKAADAIERSDATAAVGRMAGKASVDVLLAALEDPSLIVRQRAILALGSIANEPAFEALQKLAETGRVKPGVDICGAAQPLAVAALAIGRRVGLDDRADRLVERVTRARSPGVGDRVAVAAMIYQTVAPCAALEKLAFELASDEKLSTPVRCRALEAVARVGTEEAFGLIEKLLVGQDLELRRSAAIALGLTKHSRASLVGYEALQRENEPVTRGFLMVSLGRIADTLARTTLIEALEADAIGRPWCALGLGLAVRATLDDKALAALRKAEALERNADFRMAYWIALGLARDHGSVERLLAAHATNSDPVRQHYAATGLALIGSPAAHEGLVARLAAEKKAHSRVSLAAMLCTFGDPADVARVGDVAAGLKEPGLQALLAFGLGHHGSLDAIGYLSKRIAAKDTNAMTRAGCSAALGILLTRHEPFVLAKASHSSNYTVYESWMDELVQSTL
ncbi:MAG: hypothetical protein L6Q99_22170 [Planctomycetes bacterium]|nr:hypothetical protein [Planctomycetota bacterium]